MRAQVAVELRFAQQIRAGVGGAAAAASAAPAANRMRSRPGAARLWRSVPALRCTTSACPAPSRRPPGRPARPSGRAKGARARSTATGAGSAGSTATGAGSADRAAYNGAGSAASRSCSAARTAGRAPAAYQPAAAQHVADQVVAVPAGALPHRSPPTRAILRREAGRQPSPSASAEIDQRGSSGSGATGLRFIADLLASSTAPAGARLQVGARSVAIASRRAGRRERTVPDRAIHRVGDLLEVFKPRSRAA